MKSAAALLLFFPCIFFAVSPAFALDNTVCLHDIDAGYLSGDQKISLEDQRKKIRPFGNKVDFSVIRTERKLTIRLENGSSQVFKSVPCESSPQTSFETYLPALNVFVVRVVGEMGENSLLKLIDSTSGKSTELQDKSIPQVSPDRQHFAVYGENYAHADNEVQIWKITPDGYQEIWSIEPQDDGYHHRGVLWLSSSHLRVQVEPDSPETRHFQVPKKILLKNGITVSFFRKPTH